MKKLILLPFFLLLAACPKQEEVTSMMEELAVQKTLAVLLIDAKRTSTNSLLDIQDYFFKLDERIFLVEQDAEAAKNVRGYINRIGANQFCADFVMPLRTWKVLQAYCKKGQMYRCSVEIDQYETNYKRLLRVLGDDLGSQMRQSPNCN